MKAIIQKVKKNIDEHRDGLEEYPQYRDMMEGEEGEKVADLIENCDWSGDSVDIGFEQGYMAGMNSTLRDFEAQTKGGLFVPAELVYSLKMLAFYVTEKEYENYEELEPEDRDGHIYEMGYELEQLLKVNQS